MFDVDVSGFQAACREFTAGLERVASDAVKTGAQVAEIKALAVIRSTTTRRTGQLENLTINYQVSSREARFQSAAKHAQFIDRGTRPHIIAAKNAKFLRFWQRGVLRFARTVHHPGTKPRPFVAQAMVAGDVAMTFVAERGVAGLCDRFNRN